MLGTNASLEPIVVPPIRAIGDRQFATNEAEVQVIFSLEVATFDPRLDTWRRSKSSSAPTPRFASPRTWGAIASRSSFLSMTSQDR
jgi:hypothetical protein